MKQFLKYRKKVIKELIQHNEKGSIIVYFLLRFLVILCMIFQFIHGDLQNALLCLLALALLFTPLLIQDKLKVTLPGMFEVMIYLFIFSAEILGEINNFYTIIPFWDTILHTLNGFLAAAVGFSLFDLLNKNSSKIKLSPFYLCVVSFCFSMTIGALWEIFEYSMDNLLKFDMQKDEIVETISSAKLDPTKQGEYIILEDISYTEIYDANGKLIQKVEDGYLDIGLRDTMGDLIVNFVGAFCFCVLGYLDLIYHNRKGVLYNLVPRKNKKETFT